MECGANPVLLKEYFPRPNYSFFFLEMGSHCVAQAVLELQCSGSLPSIASQVAETTGTCLCAQLIFVCLIETEFCHVV